MIRPATVDDYDGYARLFPHLGVDDPLPSRARFADELVDRVLVATLDGTVVGYALVEVLADTGYVRNVVTDPAHRRRGIGRALMEAMRARFVAAGATTWCLNVKPDNTAAIALYRDCGLLPAYRSVALRIPSGAPLPAPPPDLELAPVTPDDDAVVEAAFGLLRGQLASARARPSRRVLLLRRAGEILGVGVFSSSIPGAFPFRVVDPALGSGFAALLRRLAPAGAPYLQLGVEDDEALAAALLAAGAYVQLEILHLRGPLSA